MRVIIVCIMLLALSACSSQTGTPPPSGPEGPQIYCENPQPAEPIDGGIGGTGAQPGQHCDPTKF